MHYLAMWFVYNIIVLSGGIVKYIFKHIDHVARNLVDIQEIVYKTILSPIISYI